MYEGFTEENITNIERTVREAVPQLDQATIARVLELLQRIAGNILSPNFFTTFSALMIISFSVLIRTYPLYAELFIHKVKYSRQDHIEEYYQNKACHDA